MVVDTCVEYIIPAKEKDLLTNQNRAVYLILEKDGSWHKEYYLETLKLSNIYYDKK